MAQEHEQRRSARRAANGNAERGMPVAQFRAVTEADDPSGTIPWKQHLYEIRRRFPALEILVLDDDEESLQRGTQSRVGRGMVDAVRVHGE